MTRQFAQDQIARLAGTQGFLDLTRDFPAAISELINALLRATSEDHARAAIDAVIREAHFCPTSSDIRLAIEGTRPHRALPPLKREYDCPLCSDSGWIVTDRGLYTAVSKCYCQTKGKP